MKSSPAAVHGEAGGVVEFGTGGRFAVAAVAPGSVAGNGADHARGEVDLADDVVAAVGDEEVVRGVHGDAHGVEELGAGGRLAVAAVAPGPVSGNRADRAGGEVDFADDVVVAVGDEEISRSVRGDAHGVVKFGCPWPVRRCRYSSRPHFRRPC